MEPFQRRDPIPIALVGLLVLALGMITALNAGDLPIIGDGTTYNADFSEAAGLQTDDEVRIAGVKVGRVTDIALDGDRVRVGFKVKDAWLGDRTSAEIKIKSLLGAKYLALDPQGQDVLDPAVAIPRERTRAPYDVLSAFQGLASVVDELDTAQLAKSFDVLSRTFADTAPEVRGALSGLSKLSDTISSRDAQLSRLLARTRQVSRTVADRDAEVTTLLADGNLLLSELSRRSHAITALLNGSRQLATQLRGLVEDNTSQMGPVIADLDQLTSMLQRNQDSLAAGLQRFAPFIRTATNVIGNGRFVDAYLCGLVLPSIGPVNDRGCYG
jgi:phospholipid/cholesterol/gamma-HCH transport system substrate-binding protein